MLVTSYSLAEPTATQERRASKIGKFGIVKTFPLLAKSAIHRLNDASDSAFLETLNLAEFEKSKRITGSCSKNVTRLKHGQIKSWLYLKFQQSTPLSFQHLTDCSYHCFYPKHSV